MRRDEHGVRLLLASPDGMKRNSFRWYVIHFGVCVRGQVIFNCQPSEIHTRRSAVIGSVPQVIMCNLYRCPSIRAHVLADMDITLEHSDEMILLKHVTELNIPARKCEEDSIP